MAYQPPINHKIIFAYAVLAEVTRQCICTHYSTKHTHRHRLRHMYCLQHLTFFRTPSNCMIIVRFSKTFQLICYFSLHLCKELLHWTIWTLYSICNKFSRMEFTVIFSTKLTIFLALLFLFLNLMKTLFFVCSNFSKNGRIKLVFKLNIICFTASG